MRVLIAPDAFRGTLSGDQAAAAVADGWARGAAGDELTRSSAGEATALLEAAAEHDLPDLVVTGTGSLEYSSLRDCALAALAAAATARGVPCIVLAGQVHVGARVALESGIHGAYATAADVGSVEESMADPVGTLTMLAEGIAVHWGGRRGRTELHPELLPGARRPVVPGPRHPGGDGDGTGA